MTFSATKLLQTTERWMMVRLTPARCVNDDLALSGGVYQMDWSYPVAKVERNGTALTADTSTPSTNDHYYYDESAGTLKIKLADAPDDDTNVVCVFYYLFFTSGMARQAYEDPTDSTKAMRFWEPRLTSDPTIRQSVYNAVSGVLTIDDSSVSFANGDGFFNPLFGDSVSFNDKEISVWQAVRQSPAHEPDYQRVYKGRIKSPTLSPKTLEVSFYSELSLLSQPAYMGDDPEYVTLRRGLGGWLGGGNVDPTKADTVIPLLLGKYSRYKTKNHPTVYGHFQLDSAEMNEASCISYDENLATSANRAWQLCRVTADGLGSPSIGSPGDIQSIFQSGSVLSFTYTQAKYATFDVAIGDCFKFVHGTGTYYGRVSRLVPVSGSNSEIWFLTDATTTPSLTTTGLTITAFNTSLVLVDENNIEYHLLAGKHYSVTTFTPSGSASKFVVATLSNSFESTVTTTYGYPADLSSPLDPSKIRVFYRVRSDVSDKAGNHADVLKFILQKAGLTVNGTTFSAAKLALDVNCALQIPYFDEGDVNPYINYIEDVLASTLGLLAQNEQGKIEYSLVVAPSSTDSNDDNVILRDSYSVAIEYSDVVTQIIAYNPHNSSEQAIDGDSSPSETRTNNKARYLHGIINVMRFRHVLETITDRIDQILAARSHRRATYRFDVATKYLDAKIGDDVKLEKGFLLGDDTSRSVKVMSLDKSSERVSMEASDFLGVT